MVINIPPELLKSSIVSVALPSWIWSQNPKAGILGVSYDGKLNQRDATASRMLIESEWYRMLWPQVVLREDQNTKTDYRNTLGGWRISTTVGGRVTGEHPDIFIWDDPLKAQKKHDKRVKEELREFYRGTITTRGASKQSIHIIAHQRLAVDDPTSIAEEANKKALAKGLDEPWIIVRLPMRYDKALAMKNYGYGYDWRTKQGELLAPKQFTDEILEGMYSVMSQLDIDAQHQQNPKVRTGRLFKIECAQPIAEKDIPKCDAYVRFWDKSATADGGCFTAGVLIGVKRKGDDAQFYILDIRRWQWDVDEVERQIEAAARIDGARYGMSVYQVGMEQEPGSGGKLSARVTEKRLRGFRFTAIPASGQGSKETRAEPLARAVSRGEVFYVEEAAWVPDLLDEWNDFPASKFKDITDAASGAYSMLEGVIGKPVRKTVVRGVVKRVQCANKTCKRPAEPGKDYCCENCKTIASFDDGSECDEHCPQCNQRAFEDSNRK